MDNFKRFTAKSTLSILKCVLLNISMWAADVVGPQSGTSPGMCPEELEGRGAVHPLFPASSAA